MTKLIVIPTFNERENILKLIPIIRANHPEFDILVVDDNSPDGTALAVQTLGTLYPKVHLLIRSKKLGLGAAYVAGFKWGLERNFEIFIQMDADFSHQLSDLVTISRALETADFVVGSRWVTNGRTTNWSFVRSLVSRSGSLYTRCLLGFPLRDWTGGFNGWHARVLKSIGLDNIKSQDYSFQVEMKYLALKLGHLGREVPIVFAGRQHGKSKMSLRIVLKSLFDIWSLQPIREIAKGPLNRSKNVHIA